MIPCYSALTYDGLNYLVGGRECHAWSSKDRFHMEDVLQNDNLDDVDEDFDEGDEEMMDPEEEVY